MSRRLVLACCAVLLAGPAAAAPSCAEMVGDLRAYLDAHPQASGTRPQTVDAQLMHQPTRDSVAHAKMASHDRLVELLGDAEMQQRMGDKAGCEAILADVERMLKP